MPASTFPQSEEAEHTELATGVYDAPRGVKANVQCELVPRHLREHAVASVNVAGVDDKIKIEVHASSLYFPGTTRRRVNERPLTGAARKNASVDCRP